MKKIMRGGLLFSSILSICVASIGSAPLEARPLFRIDREAKLNAAPTNALCLSTLGYECLAPADIQTAYGLDTLLNAGLTGVGETIVIIDSYGSPTIKEDLKRFDKDYGIPDPPSFKVLSPLGTVPYDPSQPDQVGWAEETSIDVEWAHAMAPGASIVLLTSPVDETSGVQGMPEFLKLAQYALDHHLGKIFSQSWGTTENTLFADMAGPAGPATIRAFEAFYQQAASQSVSVLVSSGDDGAQNTKTYDQATGESTSYYTFPTVGYPTSSPWVTSVGGTALYLDAEDNYLYETVWDDDALGYGAGGGGVSQVFAEPFYQAFTLPRSQQKLLGLHRGIPDVSYNADDYNSPIPVYLGFLGGADNGYYLFGGTSCGAPQWAGIVADLNQLAGHPLGLLNPRLYAVGALGLFPKVGRDITIGDNTYQGVQGYDAVPGWDMASGWGTPDLKNLPKWWRAFMNAD